MILLWQVETALCLKVWHSVTEASLLLQFPLQTMAAAATVGLQCRAGCPHACQNLQVGVQAPKPAFDDTMSLPSLWHFTCVAVQVLH